MASVTCGGDAGDRDATSADVAAPDASGSGGPGAPCDPAEAYCDPARADLCLVRPGGAMCSLACEGDDACQAAFPGGCCRPVELASGAGRACFPAADCAGTTPVGGVCPEGVGDCAPPADRCVLADGVTFCTFVCDVDADCQAELPGGVCVPGTAARVCAPGWLVELAQNPGGPGTSCGGAAGACDPARAPLCFAGLCTRSCASSAECDVVFPDGCCALGADGVAGCLPAGSCDALRDGSAGAPCVGVGDCDVGLDRCAGPERGPTVCTHACERATDCEGLFGDGCCADSVCLPRTLCPVAPSPGALGGGCDGGKCDAFEADVCAADLCTLTCQDSAICGDLFADGCCMTTPQGGAACVPASRCAAPEGAGGPGAPCASGFDADCDPRTTQYCVGYGDAERACTTLCLSSADCQAVMPGGCCLVTDDERRVCVPAAGCPAGGDGGLGAACAEGFAACDPAASDVCLGVPSGRVCSRRCRGVADCVDAFEGGCCLALDEGFLACAPAEVCHDHGAWPGAPCVAADDCASALSQACVGPAGGKVCAPACESVLDCAGLFADGACCLPVPDASFRACHPAASCAVP